MAEALGMCVVLADRKNSICTRPGRMPFSLALKTGTVFFVAERAVDAKKGMIGAAELESMSASSYIVNVSSGGVINEQALAEALKNGEIAGAATDSFEKEPVTKDNSPLLQADLSDRLVLSPRTAWVCGKAVEERDEVLKSNIERFIAGKPKNQVNLTPSKVDPPSRSDIVEANLERFLVGKTKSDLIPQPTDSPLRSDKLKARPRRSGDKSKNVVETSKPTIQPPRSDQVKANHEALVADKTESGVDFRPKEIKLPPISDLLRSMPQADTDLDDLHPLTTLRIQGFATSILRCTRAMKHLVGEWEARVKLECGRGLEIGTPHFVDQLTTHIGRFADLIQHTLGAHDNRVEPDFALTSGDGGDERPKKFMKLATIPASSDLI